MVFVSVFVALKRSQTALRAAPRPERGKILQRTRQTKKQRKKLRTSLRDKTSLFFCFNASGRAKGA